MRSHNQIYNFSGEMFQIEVCLNAILYSPLSYYILLWNILEYLHYIYFFCPNFEVMKIKVLAFGISKDIFGGSSVSLELANDATVYNLKYMLEHQYPRLGQLASYMVAVNNEYALPGDTIHERDEIAIIPPVSGG